MAEFVMSSLVGNMLIEMLSLCLCSFLSGLVYLPLAYLERDVAHSVRVIPTRLPALRYPRALAFSQKLG